MRIVRTGLWVLVALAGIGTAALWLSDRAGVPMAGRSPIAGEGVSADFELTDHNGMIQTDEDFRGRWMLVFFGFTNCPDVCPTGLATIAQAMDDLGSQAPAVQALFITVDPERDGPSVLADYVPQFGPTILGLSGSPEQIERTASGFKISYEKIEEALAPGGYTMEHTSSFLLFGPQGEFVRVYGYDAEIAEIVTDLRARIDA